MHTSDGYCWDVLCRRVGACSLPLPSRRAGDGCAEDSAGELLRGELFGLDGPHGCVAEYFKAAAGGCEVRRRLLLGPRSGGKLTLAILLKRRPEEYRRTEDGALYAIRGAPVHENPQHLIYARLRGACCERYGVSVLDEQFS